MNKKILNFMVCFVLSVSLFTLPVYANDGIDMYRIYNPNSGEHFYTSSTSEKNHLVSLGWKYEGIGWNAPKTSNYPVYRLYNGNGGEHHYTMSASEKNMLVNVGWSYEGIGWYSADPNNSNSIPLLREYNPNAFANNHNYTTSKAEHDWLVSLGWKDEGKAWYGQKVGTANTNTDTNSDQVVLDCRHGGSHNWINYKWEDLKQGYSCNTCYKDITDYSDLYSCHLGWHTQEWYLFPSYYVCSTCGKYYHKHQWTWIKPEFNYSDDSILRTGYWMCYRCGAQSSNGSSADEIMFTQEGYPHGSRDWWVTPFDFEKDSHDWIIEDEYWDKEDNNLYLQSIGIKRVLSLSVGDTYQLNVQFTPKNPVEGKSVSWESDNENVVKVDSNGKVTAVGEGKAIVTATSSKLSSTCVIRVTSDNVGVVKLAELCIKNSNGEEIALNPNTIIDLEKGKYTIYLKTSPSNAVYEVRYAVDDYDSENVVVNLSGSSLCGTGTSVDSWNRGIVYTNSESQIHCLNEGDALLRATISDINGNEIELKQSIHVN